MGQNYWKKQACLAHLQLYQIPSRPKLLQKNSLQRKCFGAIDFCKNYKRITLQSKFLGLFSCKKGHTCGSNITKKILWLNYFCNSYKNYYKRKCSEELFCNNFGQDGTQQQQKYKIIKTRKDHNNTLTPHNQPYTTKHATQQPANKNTSTYILKKQPTTLGKCSVLVQLTTVLSALLCFGKRYKNCVFMYHREWHPFSTPIPNNPFLKGGGVNLSELT